MFSQPCTMFSTLPKDIGAKVLHFLEPRDVLQFETCSHEILNLSTDTGVWMELCRQRFPTMYEGILGVLCHTFVHRMVQPRPAGLAIQWHGDVGTIRNLSALFSLLRFVRSTGEVGERFAGGGEGRSSHPTTPGTTL